MTLAIALASEARIRMPSDELAASPALGRWEPLELAGEGVSSVVWKVRRRDGSGPAVFGALKLARGPAGDSRALQREASLLARVGRRWGPSLLDAGTGFLVASWTEGVPVDALAAGGSRRKREELAAHVAHSVGRALDELHQAGVHHGDVKPGNVLLAPQGARARARDAAAERSATLIDLGLGGDIGAPARGGTPRYASPELRQHGEAGPAADLWALGVLLAELLEPGLGQADDPRAAIATWLQQQDGSEPARWVEALVATSPGGRPSAAWLGSRAARWLGLARDEAEEGLARLARVRRTYLSARAPDVLSGSPVSPVITGAARDWLEESLELAFRLDAASAGGGRTIEPLGALRTTRWLVSLVGPAAAAWPLRDDPHGETNLVGRAVELARLRDPSAWTLDDLGGQRRHRSRELGPGPGRRAAGAPGPRAGAVDSRVRRDRARRERARIRSRAGGAGDPAGDGARARRRDRASVGALAPAEGADADALRAEIARRRGETALAASNAERASPRRTTPPCAAAPQATLARLAWDAGDLDEAELRLKGPRDRRSPRCARSIAWRRGTHEPALEELRSGARRAAGGRRARAPRGCQGTARARARGLGGGARVVRARGGPGDASGRARGGSDVPDERGGGRDRRRRHVPRARRARRARRCCGRGSAVPGRPRGRGSPAPERSRRSAPRTGPTRPRPRQRCGRWRRGTCAPRPSRAGPRSRCALRATSGRARGR